MSEEKHTWNAKRFAPQVSEEVALRASQRASEQKDVEWLTESVELDRAEYSDQKSKLEQNVALSQKIGKISAALFVAGLGGVLVGYAPFVNGLDIITYENLNDFSKALVLGGELAIVGGCAVELVKQGVDHVGGKIKDAMKKISDSIKTAEYKKAELSIKDELENIPAAPGKYEKPGEEEINAAVDNDKFFNNKQSFAEIADALAHKKYVDSLAEQITSNIGGGSGEHGLSGEQASIMVDAAENVATTSEFAMADKTLKTPAQYAKPDARVVEDVPPNFFGA